MKLIDIFFIDSLNSTLLSQGGVFGTTSSAGKESGVHNPSTRVGVRRILLPGSGSWVNQRSYLLQDLL